MVKHSTADGKWKLTRQEEEEQTAPWREVQARIDLRRRLAAQPKDTGRERQIKMVAAQRQPESSRRVGCRSISAITERDAGPGQWEGANQRCHGSISARSGRCRPRIGCRPPACRRNASQSGRSQRYAGLANDLPPTCGQIAPNVCVRLPTKSGPSQRHLLRAAPRARRRGACGRRLHSCCVLPDGGPTCNPSAAHAMGWETSFHSVVLTWWPIGVSLFMRIGRWQTRIRSAEAVLPSKAHVSPVIVHPEWTGLVC